MTSECFDQLSIVPSSIYCRADANLELMKQVQAIKGGQVFCSRNIQVLQILKRRISLYVTDFCGSWTVADDVFCCLHVL